MVAATFTETDDFARDAKGTRWLGYLVLSVLVNIVILSAIDLSKQASPITVPLEFKISFSSVAKSSQKAEPIRQPQPVQEAVQIKTPEPVMPTTPAPVMPVTAPVVTKKIAQKAVIQVKKVPETPAPEPVLQAEAVVPAPPAPRPKVKPRLTLAPKPVPAPVVETVAVQPVPVKPLEKVIEPPVQTALAKPTEKPVQLAQEELQGEEGKGPSTIIGQANYKRKFQPRYPRRAADMGQQGEVKLHVLVARDGKAKELKIAQSSGYRLLDKAALAAVRKWEFVPKRQGTVTVASWVSVPVDFKLR
ncbi:MAG: energy transducer TonB [Sneathiella sp.]